MKTIEERIRDASTFLAVAALFLLALASFGGYRYFGLSAELQQILQQLADTEREAGILQERLSAAEEELRQEKAKMDAFMRQIEQITGAVGILQQLQGTDREILQKYSRTYFLSEHYVPSQLSSIEPKYLYDSGEAQQIHAKVKPFLENMLDAADSARVSIKIVSAYRSAYKQSRVNSQYNVVYGTGANQFSAEQGYSEHQLGTTVDVTTPESGAEFVGFEDARIYEWLSQNAYRYGFVLSYPEANPYYVFEPWHWRYVGVKLAALLYEQNKHFYDLEQEKINQYLLDLFD